MSKEVSTKEINAGFLAIVLIVGTFAAISPSFMIGAHAQQYGLDPNSYESDYGMDNSYDDKQSYGKDSNSYDKSKDSSTLVKKIKCNNINANLNGFNGVEIGTLPTALTGLATDEAQATDEGEVGASSSGSGSGSDGGRPSGSDNDSRICINNNDFTVVVGEEPVPQEPVPPDPAIRECEKCFTKNLKPEQLEVVELALKPGIDITIGGETITIDSLLELCTELKVATPDEVMAALNAVLRSIVLEIFEFAAILDCIGFALDIDVLPL